MTGLWGWGQVNDAFDGGAVARLTLPGEDALPLPLSDHVARDDVTHDARHEHVAARCGHQPATPLQLVERRVQRVADQVSGGADAARRHALTEERRGHQRLLRRSRETPKAYTNRRDDRVGKIARERRVERAQRTRPRAIRGLEIEALGHRVTDLDGEE